MTREQHLSEVERYEMLAREAEKDIAANTPEYYRRRADEHRAAAAKAAD